VEAAEVTACPIERGYIFSLKGVDKVVGIVASEVFDGKVINTEAESGGTGWVVASVLRAGKRVELMAQA